MIVQERRVFPQPVDPELARLAQIHDRHPEARPALSVAWAACRTATDWCKAAELRAGYGDDVPVFTYPRGPVPPATGIRPWISRLL
ncbi:hypothetical protein [Acrocarpospora corrugata]|uniref:hypothetical protein n=2 Tax=Acrocarpospora corrugata TaxID=35763 RepID=UPI0031E42393